MPTEIRWRAPVRCQLVYTGTMKTRMNVYLDSHQKEQLEKLSQKTGAPVAELIRRAIDSYLKKAGK